MKGSRRLLVSPPIVAAAATSPATAATVRAAIVAAVRTSATAVTESCKKNKQCIGHMERKVTERAVLQDAYF